ncbi:MAG TPA: lytic transglycosylase domain-containing protein [Nevskiaceae bacterium]|nr:lytic transglycosylase domain-containing protein [Nevskiaceae bacterium]
MHRRSELRAATLVALVALALPVAAVAKPYAACFATVGNYYHINPLLLEAIAHHESDFNPIALHHNPNGSWDIGVMQINSSWIPTLRRAGVDPNRLVQDPCLNIAVGGAILALNIHHYGLSWRAVGAYNAVTPWKQDRYAAAIERRLLIELHGQ